jgi:hypothetical protein
MANICITSACNRKCSYCFVQEPDNSRAFMKLEDFKRSIAFLDRSHIDQVRILGGEPALHPDFKEIMTLAKKTGKKILLFTNGLISDEVLEFLMEFPSENLTAMVNVTPLDTEREDEIDKQRRVIERLGPRAALSFNIFKPDISFEVLVGLLENSDAQRMIRLGLALPCLDGNNESLHPRQYSFVGSRIVRFATKAADLDITVSFDCGFVPCMFGEEGLKVLKDAKADIGWRCNPILDITTSGKVLHCFPLARKYFESLSDEIEAAALRGKFMEQSRHFRQTGIYRDCSLCDLKHSEVCLGGCLSATIRRFQ